MRNKLWLTDCWACQVKSFHEGMRLVSSISKVPRQMPPAAQGVVLLSQCLMAFCFESECESVWDQNLECSTSTHSMELASTSRLVGIWIWSCWLTEADQDYQAAIGSEAIQPLQPTTRNGRGGASYSLRQMFVTCLAIILPRRCHVMFMSYDIIIMVLLLLSIFATWLRSNDTIEIEIYQNHMLLAAWPLAAPLACGSWQVHSS